MFQPYCTGERAAWEAGEVNRYEAEPSGEFDPCGDDEPTSEFIDLCQRVVDAAQARIRETRGQA